MIVERSRPYFEHQAVLGRRVIFSWHKSTRWPNMTDMRIAYWLKKKELDQDVIEGVQFRDEESANAFDLEATDDEYEWQIFDTWEEATIWMRGGL